jgi:hypothetical protein
VAEGLQAWWKGWTQARWEKLNEAFGEGWEKECFPYLGTGGLGRARLATRSRDEAQWDAILEAVKLFKQTHGRFPRGAAAMRTRRSCTSGCATAATGPCLWTQERANKLALAFGDRWQSECFPNTIYFW